MAYAAFIGFVLMVCAFGFVWCLAGWFIDASDLAEEQAEAAEYDRRRGYDRPHQERAEEARERLDDDEALAKWLRGWTP